MKQVWIVICLVVICWNSLSACQEPTPPDRRTPSSRRFCHTCATRLKENTKTCLYEFSSRLPQGIRCTKNHAFCVTEFVKPGPGNAGDATLQRRCSRVSINTCYEVGHNDGSATIKCIASCDTDGCNTQNTTSFPTNDNSTSAKVAKQCTGNGSTNVMGTMSFYLTLAILSLGMEI